MAKVHTVSPEKVKNRCEILIPIIEKFHADRYEKRIQNVMDLDRCLPWMKKRNRDQAIKYVQEDWTSLYYIRPFRHELSFIKKILEISSNENCEKIIMTDSEFCDVFCYKYEEEECST